MQRRTAPAAPPATSHAPSGCVRVRAGSPMQVHPCIRCTLIHEALVLHGCPQAPQLTSPPRPEGSSDLLSVLSFRLRYSFSATCCPDSLSVAIYSSELLPRYSSL